MVTVLPLATSSFVSLPASTLHYSTNEASCMRTISLFVARDAYRFVLSKVGRAWKGDTICVKCEAYTRDVPVTSGTEWVQKVIELQPYKRGCHIITEQIYKSAPEIKLFEVGLANLFVMHTSASLTINENASPDVPLDMEDSLNRIVPEGHHYRHLDEGFDDMPAHVKSSMMGCSLTIPIKGGRFNLGIWQGIWLNEHRNHGGPRRICITIQGMKRPDGRTYT